ncbi:prolipoprotein diacylglyceryl transferase, partial [Candidatus Woesearchaeota archaeon]|nr:prolipoprotein diacylglyceryl transferase [Candidatus Woesearchaeota archaeon]
YYGLVYVFGALLAYWMLERARKNGKLTLSEKDTSDLLLWLVLGVVLGSRLFYVLFYNPTYYVGVNFWKVIAVWEGGMSFHGGFFGIVLACYLFCRKKKIDMLHVADILSAPLMLALTLGRVANFINGELWGTVTRVRWCVGFPQAPDGGTLCRHPYQLYDGVKRLAVFFWLARIGRREFQPGFVFWNLVFFEGLGRFFLDFYKGVDPVFVLKPGQWMSLIMMMVAAYFFWTRHRGDIKAIFKQRI